MQIYTRRGYERFDYFLEMHMDTLNLSITGMSCGHCVARVKETLDALPGVHAEQVTIGTASVSYDAKAQSAETIARAVSEAGYPASPVR